MTTLQAVQNSAFIDNEELHEITKIMFDSFAISKKSQMKSQLLDRERMLDSFSCLVEEYLNLNLSASKDKQLVLIKFLAKLKLQKELIQLTHGETNIKEISKAGERLGKKSQSAFESK